jgi:hypothetical protein
VIGRIIFVRSLTETKYSLQQHSVGGRGRDSEWRGAIADGEVLDSGSGCYQQADQ